jgi:hypothetical protein
MKIKILYESKEFIFVSISVIPNFQQRIFLFLCFMKKKWYREPFCIARIEALLLSM